MGWCPPYTSHGAEGRDKATLGAESNCLVLRFCYDQPRQGTYAPDRASRLSVSQKSDELQSRCAARSSSALRAGEWPCGSVIVPLLRCINCSRTTLKKDGFSEECKGQFRTRSRSSQPLKDVSVAISNVQWTWLRRCSPRFILGGQLTKPSVIIVRSLHVCRTSVVSYEATSETLVRNR